MPTADQILASLKEISNSWTSIAIFWHIYFAVLAVTLMSGKRLSKQIHGILLGIPLLSVSILAWAYSNPFNGIVFAVVGIALIYVSSKLPRDAIQIGPLWMIIMGVALFMFGWIYPHFLDTTTFLTYVYAAPTGIIPCPTLSIVIGLALITNGLNSRKFSYILGFTGIFYGIFGVVRLGVSIDLVLLFGAVILIAVAIRIKNKDIKNEIGKQNA